MPRVEIVPYLAEHADAYEDVSPIVAMASKADEALTVFVDGQVAALATLSLLWRGVAEAWLAPTELVRRAPVGLVKALKRALAEAAGRLRLHRVQASVLSSKAMARRFVLALGFAHEGSMRAFGPNAENFERYARVF